MWALVILPEKNIGHKPNSFNCAFKNYLLKAQLNSSPQYF
ncbi:hypothetical protein J538_2972 [Acinetobacter sp. 272263]|nr:hypothetical protein J538_2972 [Acinetobacter sp. 272263]